jgi:hypothetical protein
MFELRFMRKPIVQIIVLVLAILFIFDMGYRLFLEKSYYLQPVKDGAVYRINKRSGEVYFIYRGGMVRVEEIVSTEQKKNILAENQRIIDELKKSGKVSYSVSWNIILPIISIFFIFNVFVWIIIQRKRKYDSSLP